VPRLTVVLRALASAGSSLDVEQAFVQRQAALQRRQAGPSQAGTGGRGSTLGQDAWAQQLLGSWAAGGRRVRLVRLPIVVQHHRKAAKQAPSPCAVNPRPPCAAWWRVPVSAGRRSLLQPSPPPPLANRRPLPPQAAAPKAAKEDYELMLSTVTAAAAAEQLPSGELKGLAAAVWEALEGLADEQLPGS